MMTGYFNNVLQICTRPIKSHAACPFKPLGVLRRDQRSLDCSQPLRMRRKLLPQTAAAAVIRQRRATGENLSVLNHGDVLNDAFRRGKRRVSSCLFIIRLLPDTV